MAARPLRGLRCWATGIPSWPTARSGKLEAERPQLVPIAGPFDGFHATQASVSKTCLVRFDNNKYWSPCMRSAAGFIQAYADRIVIRQDGTTVGEHQRRFGRGETIYDPWHYVPVLGQEARRAQKRCPVQGLAVARRPGAGATPAEGV